MLAITAAAALLLSGCGFSSGDVYETMAVPTASTAKATLPKAPKGYQWVTATHANVAVLAPSAWKGLDMLSRLDAMDPAAAKAMAAQANYTVAQLRAEFDAFDAYVTAASGANVDIALFRGKPMPTKAALRRRFTDHKGRVVSTTTVKTRIGTGVELSYIVTIAGKRTWGRSVFVHTDAGLVNIDMACPTNAQASAVAKVLIASIRPMS